MWRRSEMRNNSCAIWATLVITAFALISAPRPTLAQAGSTGGTIGKTDKSVSGGEEQTPRPSKRKPVFVRREADNERSPLVSGQYEVVADGIYNAAFTIKVNGSTFSGSSTWPCCPGHRVDPIVEGHIQGGKISFARICSGQGQEGVCRQVYTGSITENGASGQWTGTGAVFGAGSWTMRKR
jgi:hypothetical protein